MPKGHYERKPRAPELKPALEMPEGTNGDVPRGMMADMREMVERPMPFAPEPEIKPAEADAELAAEPVAFDREVPADLTTPYAREMVAGFYQAPNEAAREEMAQRMIDTAQSQDEAMDAERVRAKPLAEPITLAVPPHDIVNFKVGMWAGSFCRGEHQATWQPADDGASLEVTLVTAHGTSTLKAPAGNWTEADVDAALAQMRSDLRV